MIKVDLDKIITAKALKEHLEQILHETEEEEELFVITKNGRPKAALVNVDYLQELMGKNIEEAEDYDKYDRFDKPVATAGEPVGPIPTAGLTKTAASNTTSSDAVEKQAKPVEPEEPVESLDLPELNIDDLNLEDETPAEPPIQMPVSPVPDNQIPPNEAQPTIPNAQQSVNPPQQ